ncbi:hypothetical protein BT67DRAFT_437412 [Trichocladium antarcticum]|uniref:Mid2 domain-containing protein n=1 Tax=Trichocladium antarcticum TaxID=1450529 RepID=A0AAN6UC26_9PEZI|nr:hypothetical protein BT67DRAFT_437412 [Trichocladium antarcticum]
MYIPRLVLVSTVVPSLPEVASPTPTKRTAPQPRDQVQEEHSGGRPHPPPPPPQHVPHSSQHHDAAQTQPHRQKRATMQDQNATIGAVVGVLLAVFLAGFFYFVWRYRGSIRVRTRSTGSKGSRGSRGSGSGSRSRSGTGMGAQYLSQREGEGGLPEGPAGGG